MKIRLKKWVKLFLFIIVLLISFYLYSRYLGSTGINVKEYPIINSSLPENFYGLKIVHLGDIHYKVSTNKKELEKIVNEINLLKPDIVILSGDLFDSNINYSKDDYNDLKELLNNIDYNIGKYAIKGEEDLHIKEFDEILKDSNFIDLNNKYELIYNNGLDPILLIGISSNYESNHISNTFKELYSSFNTDYKYSILVLHEPDFIDDIEYNKFNLILSGHSHNGEIVLPIIGGIIKNKYSQKYYKEYYDLNGTELFITSGIGTNKYKMRFLNKPSINLYRLRNI